MKIATEAYLKQKEKWPSGGPRKLMLPVEGVFVPSQPDVVTKLRLSGV